MGAVPLARVERAEDWEGLGTGALVERAQTGDARAFEALYRRLVGRIYALCLRMARDAQRAEELTQDVFVRAWERLGSFRGESEFTTWLHRLAVNVVLQEGRAKGRRESREESMADPGEYLGRVREDFPGTRMDLERAIASLPEGARRVVVLRDVYGYKYDEIAKMQGVALGTVKAQIHRARKLMRERLNA
ncbi:MAG: sigma-70 family RNA polymerase sigma factor [Gemmatimonadota bacterium]